jgi:MoxR-like ATPase
MKFPFYRGDESSSRPEEPLELPASRRAERERPEAYLADPGLKAAVNTALLLSQPLLLTGDPGTGKTQLASSIAWELGLEAPLKFETKSTSTARDLFYWYDALRHFQARQAGVDEGPLAYIDYRALGTAILRANDPAAVSRYLSPGFQHGGKRRSVVLIDEIDKAPRDLPNDVLNEIEQLFFRVPELGNEPITAPHDLRPVVVITSNSERDLPEAFLRRCAYYHIEFPTPERLGQIVTGRLGAFAGGTSPFFDKAIQLFYQLRDSGLRKKPATAEFLDWLMALRQATGTEEEDPLAIPDLARNTLSVLVKTEDDQKRAREIVDQWFQNRP